MKKIILFMACAFGPSNMCGQWSLTGTGLPEKANIKNLAVKDGTLFAAASEGLYTSFDDGATWQKKNLNDTREEPYLQTLCISGDSILAGGANGIFVSADKGNTWGLSDRVPKSQYYEKIFSKGFILYYGCYNGLYYSFNKGIYWNEITGSIKRETFMDEDGDDIKVKTIRYFIVMDKSVFVGTSSGVYLSNDQGKTWESRNEGLPKKHAITYLEKIGDNFFCSTGDGLYVSADKGLSWKKAENSLPKNTTITCVIGSGTTMYAAVWQKGIFISADMGATWAPINTGFPKKFNAWNLMIHNNRLYAGGVQSGLWVTELSKVSVGK